MHLGLPFIGLTWLQMEKLENQKRYFSYQKYLYDYFHWIQYLSSEILNLLQEACWVDLFVFQVKSFAQAGIYFALLVQKLI